MSAYLAFNLFDAVTLGQKPGVLVWLVLAGAVAVGRLAQVEMASRAASGWRPRLARLWPLAAALPVLALSVTPLAARNLAYLRLDYAVLEGGAGPQVPDDRWLARDARRLGLASLARRDTAKAMAHWAADPQAADYLTGFGAWLREERGAADALPWLDLAVRADPAASAGYYYRGLAQLDLDALANARADLELALANAGLSGVEGQLEARMALTLGEILERQGAKEEAVEAYRRATWLDPEVGYYFLRLGDALLRLGDAVGAGEAYARAEQAG
jgi:tetratricopeptide (TPR) repeat protein